MWTEFGDRVLKEVNKVKGGYKGRDEVGSKTFLCIVLMPATG